MEKKQLYLYIQYKKTVQGNKMDPFFLRKKYTQRRVKDKSTTKMIPKRRDSIKIMVLAPQHLKKYNSQKKIFPP